MSKILDIQSRYTDIESSCNIFHLREVTSVDPTVLCISKVCVAQKEVPLNGIQSVHTNSKVLCTQPD